jgi:hypothetical protein
MILKILAEKKGILPLFRFNKPKIDKFMFAIDVYIK